MKKNAIKVAALAAIVVLGLAGCGQDSATGSDSDAAALASIAWSADAAGIPVLTFEAPLSLAEAASRLVKEGNGAEIAEDDLVTFDYTFTNGVDGSVSASTYTDALGSQSLVLSEAVLDPVFYAALLGQKVGAEIIYGTVSPDPSGLTTDLVAVFAAITISDVSTPLVRAVGTAVPPVDGLPAVTLSETGEPTVTIPATNPPAELISQTLIEGAGATVGEGQFVLVNYSGWLWDGTSFDSSWSSGEPAAFTLSTDSLITGWIQGLVGTTVGSQVLLVIPPSLGYGDAGSGSIPPNATLVFVIDVLAAA